MESTGTEALMAPSNPSPTEGEQVRSLFQRIADTVVQASSLQGLVADLEGKVNALAKQADELHSRNAYLQEALSQSHEARAKAEAERNDAQREASEARVRLTNIDAENTSLRLGMDDVNQRLQDTIKDRDDKGMALLEAEDKIKALEAKLAEIKGFAQTAFGLTEPPKPEAEQQPKAFEADPPPAFLQTTATPSRRNPDRIYEDEQGFAWDGRQSYDYDVGKYYIRA
jgi:hypothetical protein